MHNYLLPEPKVHIQIGKLSPTPENLIIALRGKRFNRNQHRRYYFRPELILEWLGATRRGYVVSGCPDWVYSDAEKFDLYVDINNMDVVMVRPRSEERLIKYGDRLIAGLQADLTKAVPRRFDFRNRMDY